MEKYYLRTYIKTSPIKNATVDTKRFLEDDICCIKQDDILEELYAVLDCDNETKIKALIDKIKG